VRIDGPHLRNLEPEPQQVPSPILLFEIVERGSRMQDRVVFDEVHLAGLQPEFQHQLLPLRNLLEAVENGELDLAHRPAKVRHVGEAIAIIVAESRDQAEDAAERVTWDLEELPAVVDPEAAVHPESPIVNDRFQPNLIGRWRRAGEVRA
jgi:hypothetical protein